MKKFLIFVAGMITGAMLLLAIAYFYSENKARNRKTTDLVMFDQPAECIGNYRFQIIQTLEPGKALAIQLEHQKALGEDMPTDITVLLYSPDKEPYYDRQTIRIPKGKCAKHVGTYKYVTVSDKPRTVPVVQILPE